MPVLAARVQAQVTVIANAEVPVDSIGRGLLLELYTGDVERWQNQTPVIVIDLTTKGPVRDSFYAYLGKTSSRMRSIWLKRKLTGEGELPESIDSEEDLIDRVAQTEGAIGFVSAGLAERHPEVKILIAAIPLMRGNP
jgi:ABC-type phosphate transport system substrate-binding protein